MNYFFALHFGELLQVASIKLSCLDRRPGHQPYQLGCHRYQLDCRHSCRQYRSLHPYCRCRYPCHSCHRHWCLSWTTWSSTSWSCLDWSSCAGSKSMNRSCRWNWTQLKLTSSFWKPTQLGCSLRCLRSCFGHLCLTGCLTKRIGSCLLSCLRSSRHEE